MKRRTILASAVAAFVGGISQKLGSAAVVLDNKSMLKWSVDIPTPVHNGNNAEIISVVNPKYVRLVNRVRWHSLEKSFNVYDVSQLVNATDSSVSLDSEIRYLSSRGIKPVVTFRGCPLNYSVSSSQWNGARVIHADKLYSVAAWMARTFGDSVIYEFENEPDVPRDNANTNYGGYGSSFDDGVRYGKLLTAFNDGIKSSASNAVVMSGGLMANNMRDCKQFVSGMMSLKSNDLRFDILSIHAHQHSHYSGGTICGGNNYDDRNDWFWEGLHNKIVWFNNMMLFAGLKKPISINECSLICSNPEWGTCNENTDEFELDQLLWAGKAHGMCNALSCSGDVDIHSLFWYQDAWKGASLTKNGRLTKAACYIHKVNNG